MAIDREQLAADISVLAQRGIFLGTSSWKYSGWRGQLYHNDRYIWRGKFSESRFQHRCLEEYGEVFKTVCVDAAYYKFPDPESLQSLAAQVPNDFRFTFKVTDEITIKHFPKLPRFGHRAGTDNPNFLNADLFRSGFLEPCAAIRDHVGVLIFEFSHFHPTDFARGRDFVQALDSFLGELPTGWRYGIEIRNRSFLHPDYFAVLARHDVTHVFNSWQEMPSVLDQMSVPGVFTAPELIAARFLLRPGRRYDEAVEVFSPYDRVQEVYAEGREAGAALIRHALASAKRTRAFLYINNRFEGNALETIQAMIHLASSPHQTPT